MRNQECALGLNRDGWRNGKGGTVSIAYSADPMECGSRNREPCLANPFRYWLHSRPSIQLPKSQPVSECSHKLTRIRLDSFVAILSQFPRVVYASSLFRIFRISRTSLLAANFHFKASNRPRSSIRCIHITLLIREKIILEFLDLITNNVTDNLLYIIEITRLSDKGYRELIDLYFEIILKYSSETQK
jgi:hypothetical protein